ncbi:MAG: DUF6515 family protein [Bacteroidota bacterium]
MGTKNYTIRFIFIMGILLLLFNSGVLAQRGRGHSYRYGYGYRHSYYHGPRVYSFAHPYVSIGYRGINYRHYGGYFYRPFRGYYRAVIPPFGFYISILPSGYRRIYVDHYPYYYYNGIYYSPYGNGYKVVAPPLGARVPELPRDAQAVIIDGQKYYVLDGTYYQEEIVNDNDVDYVVVGRNGVLNNADNSANDGSKIGDRVSRLPADCRAVVISGKKYYESPDGIYYEKIISPNKVEYEVVGKPDE